MFLDDFDRWRFLDLLAEMAHRFDIEIIAYALMGNHYHIVINCKSSNLSDAMHWFATQYVRGFNKRHGFDGTLFRSRFHSVEITDEPQLLTTVRYVHRNPLDLDPETDLASYPWSSHAAYLGWRTTPAWLSTSVVRAQFGSLEQYQDFVETALPTDEIQNVGTSRPPTKTSSAPPDMCPSPADVQRAVADAAEIDLRALSKPSGYDAKRARLAALVICVDMFAIAPTSLINIFGFSSSAALSSALTRARRRLEADGEFTRLVTGVYRIFTS